MSREPVFDSDTYALYMSGGVEEGTESGGECDSFIYHTFWWEGSAVIVHKNTGKAIQFSCFTETQRDRSNLQDPWFVILRTTLNDPATWEKSRERRAVTADEICLTGKLSEIIDFICQEFLDSMDKDPDPIKKICLRPIPYQELLKRGFVADQNDQIPLLVT